MIGFAIGLLLVADSVAQFEPHCDAGRQGKVIVHLFEWKWTDIAWECENVLGPQGFCGVQISPPNEHRVVLSPDRPWWERYQPVSYQLHSRSGTRAEFTHMVQKCNAAGVRVYIDAVINHMAGVDSGSGYGTGGSYYDTQAMRFDGVPFGSLDFGGQCPTASGNIEDYGNAEQVRNCRLLGLLDLAGGNSYVRNKIADFFNDMLDIGIDGYRIDAAKHMWPGDIAATLALTRDTIFGGRPLVFQEVIDLYGNEPIRASHYTHLGKVTEFKYGLRLGEVFKSGQTALTHLKSFGSSWGMLDDQSALVFIDNHDNQRGHGGGGNIISYKTSTPYKMAVAFMLSWPYGMPRVMSSYSFTEDWTGPPNLSPGHKMICENGWICEHRWRQILNMVEWRNEAGESPVSNWWSNGNNQIAYGRGSSSFIAFNKRDGVMSEWLTTGLPAGVYCDIISGNLVDSACTGNTIVVHDDTTALIEIDGSSEDPIVAIHLGSRLQQGGMPTNRPITDAIVPTRPPPTGRARTLVFIKRQTSPGENLFLRGGCLSNCALTLEYHPRTASPEYSAWSQGDTVLDWLGSEPGQGTYNGMVAQGSPMMWTTNQVSHDNYVQENRFGEHYWLWDVYLDCSTVSDGWFEVKGYLNGEWEQDMRQEQCAGVAQNGLVSTSSNHLARCGYINVFEWNSSSCKIFDI